MKHSHESTAPPDGTPPSHRSGKRLIFTLASIAAILFLAEFAIMAVLPLFELEGIAESALDSFLLALLALPAIYALGFRPRPAIHAKHLGRLSRPEWQTAILLLLQVVMIAAVVTVYALLVTGRDSGIRVVEVAGSQRALSQNIVQRAMSHSMELAHEPLAGRTPGTAAVIDEAIIDFERNLRALADGDAKLGVPRCVSNEAAAQLGVVGIVWPRLRALAEGTSVPRTMDEADAYFHELQGAGGRVYQETDKAVTLLTNHYTGRARTIRAMLGMAIVLAVATCLLLAITCFQMMRNRRQAEEKLREAKDYTDNIIRSMIDMLVVVAPDGTLRTVNEATRNVLGYSAEELIGHPASLLFSEEEVEAEEDEEDEDPEQLIFSHQALPFKRTVLRRLVKDGAISNIEKLLLTKSGHTIPVLLSGSVMRNKDGAVRGITCVAQDITERKRLVTALLEANKDLFAVNEVHQVLFECQTAREVANKLADALVHELEAYFARVWLIRPGDLCSECALAERCPQKERCLHLVASSGHYTHIDGDHRRVPPGVFKIGLVAQGRGKTISSDVTNDERVHDREWASKHGLQSFAGLPLIRDGEVIGVMAMFSKHRLPQHALDTLDLLARVGSAALSSVEKTEALRDSEETFRNISTSAQDAIVMMDGDGNVTYWNDAAEAIFGYAREEAIGKHVHSEGFMVPERFHEAHSQAWPRFQERGEGPAIGKTTESFGLRKNGEEFPVEFSLSAVKIKGRWHAISMLRDVTERKNAEAELRKLSVAVEQSPASVVITDTQGTIEYVNPRFTEVTGYTAEEAVGQNPRILKGGNKPKESYKKLWDTILAGRIWTGAFENKKKNGELYWEEASICPIRDTEGAVTHFLAVKQDITRAKRTEKALRDSEVELREHRDNLEALVRNRTAELAKSNDTLIHEIEVRREAEIAAEKACSAKGDFLATMSHELRTPLNGIIGMTELLLGSGLTSEQKRQGGLVKASGDILLRLINDILDFSKIEAGKLELEVTDFNLRNSIECVATLLGPQAEQKGLELTVGVNPAVPTAVRGDPGRLQQILTNLVSNAIKFTEHGHIIIRAVVDDENESSVSVRISVSDTGIGIPAEQQDLLFQSFSQLDASHSRRFGGTGLGLAISKQLVEMMGGEIGAISTAGPGSTFWFCVTLEKGVERRRPLHIPNDFRRLRVLAVDDNATNREILAEQLTGFGIAHELASDGEHALKALRKAVDSQDEFALAIIDSQMPDMSGEQLAQAVRSDPNLRETILLLLTSAGIIGDEQRMNALGFSAWLPKPIRQSELLNAITLALASARTDASYNCDETTELNPCSTQRPRTTGAKILAAEDNEIGQEVIRQVLSQAGYSYEIVANGRGAVDAWHNGDFDLVLMDCQMPEMDGFEAAREIRRAEQEDAKDASASPRTPILALTANALEGDRERCIDAGMDDHIAKPFDPAQLIDAIESKLAKVEHQKMHYIQSESSDQITDDLSLESQPSGCADDTPPPFEIDTVLKRWGGDRDFVQKLIDKFLASAPSEMDQLIALVNNGDIDETTRLAHGLKGAAAYCGAERFRQSAARLEEMGRAGSLSSADECLAELSCELDRCLAYTSVAVGLDNKS